MKLDLLIINGTVIDPNGVARADIAVDDGKITGVFSSRISARPKTSSTRRGCWFFPG